MIRKIPMLCLLLMVSLNVFASGSTGGGGYGGGGGFNSGTARPTDPLYEAGKSLANGRDRAYRGMKACIKDAGSGEVSKLKKKRLSAYKGGSVSVLASNLYNCSKPDQQLVSVMQASDVNVLMYYLNKRYRLKLVR